jgi:hypothetical protein
MQQTSKPKLSINDYGLISQTTFTVGRFLFAGLCLVIRPRILLLVSFLLGTICAVLIMSIRHGPGSAAVTSLVFFFQGPIFPLIFVLGLRGRGTHMAYVAAALVATACSGAIFPYVMYIIVFDNHKRAHYAFCVVVALFAFGSLFPIYLNLVPKAGRQIDPVRRISSHFSNIRSKAAKNGDIWQRLKGRAYPVVSSVFGRPYRRKESELPFVDYGQGIEQGRE